MSDDDFAGCDNPAYFEEIIQQREVELKELAREVLDAVSSSERNITAMLQNPRWKSTSLAQREVVLRRNILRGHERLNEALKTCATYYLQMNLDRIELAMVQEGRAKSAAEKKLRVDGLKVYEGARDFVDAIFFKHGVSNHMLGALNDAEIEQIAVRIKELLTTRGHADPR